MKSLVVAALGLVCSASAVAQDFRFDYAAGDLVSPEQVAAMHAELEAAAQEFCADQYPRKIRVAQKCAEIIVSDAVSQIGNPRLTAFTERQETTRRES